MAALELDTALEKRLKKLGIRDEDLTESFIRGTGPGGQKINKTASTVVLRHTPTGTEVRCQRERSQSANRYWARAELCDQLEAARRAARLEEQNDREKKRRQSRPRPKGLQEKILKTKHKRSEVKKSRGRIRSSD
jgi:peptide chain release factor